MSKKNKLLLLFLGLAIISCDQKRVFDEYQSVGDFWHKDSVVSFELPKLNPKEQYDLFLNIRDNNEYPFNNIFLIVSLEQPDRKVKVDTLEYVMTNPDGSLLGEGFSDIKDNKLFYKSNESFPLKGTYKVHIKQAIRKTGQIQGVEKLKGVTDVGFRIESKE